MNGPDPISFPDIETYARLMGVTDLSAWEIGTLRHMDQAAVNAMTGKNVEPRTEVSMSDGAGVKSLMRGLGAKVPKASR